MSAAFATCSRSPIRLRLMSDVPLGVFLSGGIDSSAIAALMARMIGRPLKTFSVAFKARAFSELHYARQVSQAIGAERARDRHRRAGFLRRAAPPHLARGRTDRASLERAALFRLEARARERDRRPHRRGQRRAARRLWEVPAIAPQLARRIDLREDRASGGPARSGGVSRARAWASRAAMCAGPSSASTTFPISRSSTRSRASTWPGNAACSHPASRCSPARNEPTGRRWSTSTPPTSAPACSTGCSTPT